VLYSIGNTLWLDPLVQRQLLPTIQQWTENFNVRMLLLQQDYAVENPEVSCSSLQYFKLASAMSFLYFACGSDCKVLR